jgi:predicted nucleotide-binding protein (sugar kinase/HSP70/actin superfamily)
LYEEFKNFGASKQEIENAVNLAYQEDKKLKMI